MWECPLCNEVRSGFDPASHCHYVFHFLRDSGDDDLEFGGLPVLSEAVDQFVKNLIPLMDFKEGLRRKALVSLDHLVIKLPSFPVRLRDFLRVCLENQYEWRTDEEGCAMGRLGSDIDDYVHSLLTRSTRDLRTNYFTNDYAPQAKWDNPHCIYWTEDPQACALDCSQRLGEDIVHLKRIRLRGSKYIAVP